MTYTEIVKKLIGEIKPQGEHYADSARYENLIEMCKLVNELVVEIDDVAYDSDRKEASINKAGKYAANFLSNTLGIS